jgi:hypothetical protein
MIDHVSMLVSISICELLRGGNDSESEKEAVRSGMKAMSCLHACGTLKV